MHAIAAFRNRLHKNFRHWRKWARRRGIDCFRIYDRDIPEFPLAIDWYDGRVHIQEFSSPALPPDESAPNTQEAVSPVISEVLDVPAEVLAFKTRQRQSGLSQYRKTGATTQSFVVQEGGLRFLIDLNSYLDTGLFLDHRETRATIRELAGGRRFLNLFAYTGSFSVYAADGGATDSVTVDLSNTYQDWSRRNFRLNGMDLDRHRLVRADVFLFLKQARASGERFDLVVMDPPSFSNSKKMRGVLDIQRDHRLLIRGCLELLTPGGELFFSSNLRHFKLDPALRQEALIQDIAQQTIPEDFKRHRPHRCWRITQGATRRPRPKGPIGTSPGQRPEDEE